MMGTGRIHMYYGGWPFDLEPEINGWQKCKPD